MAECDAKASPAEDEELFRAFFDNAPIGKSMTAPDGRLLRVNRAFCTMLGYSAEELQALHFADITHPDDLPQTIELARGLLAGERDFWEIDKRYIAKNRSIVWTHVTTRLHRDAQGKPLVFLTHVQDITNRRLSEDKIRSLSERQEAILAAVPDIIMEVDNRRIYTWSNLAGLAFFGDDVIGKSADFYFEGAQDTYSKVIPLFQGSEETFYVESWQRRRDGQKRLLAWWCRVLKDDQKVVKGALSTARDITAERLAEEERRSTEAKHNELSEQLRASQKLEAIGRLAGGVAHDFNNLLAVVLSYAEFALENIREGDPLRDDLEQIRDAGQRAAALTHQLLAFSRRQVLQLKPVDLNRSIVGMEKMLRRIIGEDIELRVVLAPNIDAVAADPGQIEQAIMNLVINARDAMPGGGRITMETANVTLDDEYAARHVSVSPGKYVMLAVTDNGSGMDEATRARIFEPFFTLKGQQGSGLGLSTTYGIIKQCGGNIWVYSEPGRGTTFKIYLPRTAETPDAKQPRAATKPTGGTETILVVEDEPAVRNLARRILVSLGYSVIVAANGGEALLLCEENQKEIHLLLTDVVMPRMSGKALAERLARIRPGVRVLYMSGYTDDAIVKHGILRSGTQFIAKPFSADDLARKIREVLDTPSTGGLP